MDNLQFKMKDFLYLTILQQFLIRNRPNYFLASLSDFRQFLVVALTRLKLTTDY